MIRRLKPYLLEDGAFMRWTFFSAFSFLFIVGLTTALHEVFRVGEKLAFLIPLVVVFFVNFAACRYFVYGARSQPLARQFAKFAISSLGFRVGEYAVYWVLIDIIGMWYLAAVFIVMPTSFILKFVFFKVFVFAKRAADLSADSVLGAE
jgi:putative flippase GtrA